MELLQLTQTMSAIACIAMILLGSQWLKSWLKGYAAK